MSMEIVCVLGVGIFRVPTTSHLTRILIFRDFRCTNTSRLPNLISVGHHSKDSTIFNKKVHFLIVAVPYLLTN